VGLGFPRDVETLLDAFHVLTEWSGTRDADHARACASCREALAGRASIEEAREDFVTFARNRGILAPDALAMAAARHAREWQEA
jgi:hypothetical protein